MRISPIQQNPSYNRTFGAVKFQPSIKEWNPRILETALDSIAIKQAIQENESKGLDTLLYYVNKNQNIPGTKKINEFGVVKMKESRDNFSCRFETYNNLSGIDAIIDFIKTKDSEKLIPQKLDKFNEFIEQLTQKP